MKATERSSQSPERSLQTPERGMPSPDRTTKATGKPAGGLPKTTPRVSAPGQTRLTRLPLPVLLGLLLLGGLCALLALNTASAAQELKQRSLTDANASTSDQEQQLLRDLAAKQAPAALASAAAAQGLVPNPNPAFLRINADGSVTVLGSPVPASSPVVAAAPTTSSTASTSKTPTKSAGTSPSRTPSGKASSSATASKSAPRSTAKPTSTAKPGISPVKPSPHPSSTGGH